MQYQSLMEARPQGILEILEPMLVRHMAIAGALHCLPFLSTLPSLLPNINNEQLENVCNYLKTYRYILKLIFGCIIFYIINRSKN
jgi:E3 ubiquitin-protein ligase LRSAM1